MVHVVVATSVVLNPLLSSTWTRELADALVVVVLGLILASLFLLPGGRALKSIGVLDSPNARSSHSVPTVRGMGIPILLSWGLATVLVSKPPLAFMAGVGLIVVLGAIDDFRPLPPMVRLFFQLLLSVLLAGALIKALQPGLPLVLGLMTLTLFMTATVNAVNFMDGVNGISSIHAVLWGVTYTLILIAFVQSESPWWSVSSALAGAFLAFLPWNARRSARAFLGDSGSYGLGAVVGSIAVITWFVTGSWLVALLPLGIYGLDTCLTIVHRMLKGESLLDAHREHLYQQNAIRSGSGLRAALITMAASTCLSILAILLAYRLVGIWFVVGMGAITGLAYVLSPMIVSVWGSARSARAAGTT